MPSTYETINLAIDGDKVGVVTLNRPDALNSMNTAMMRELRDCFADSMSMRTRRPAWC